jgi:hypothetical protein
MPGAYLEGRNCCPHRARLDAPGAQRATGHLSFRALRANKLDPSARCPLVRWISSQKCWTVGTIAGSNRVFKKQTLAIHGWRWTATMSWAGRANAMEAGKRGPSCNCREVLLGAAGHAQMRVHLASRSRGGTIYKAVAVRGVSSLVCLSREILDLPRASPFSTSCIAEIGCRVLSSAASRVDRGRWKPTVQKRHRDWSQSHLRRRDGLSTMWEWAG